MLLGCCAALAACGKGKGEGTRPEADPALTSVLAGPVMVDGELSGQSHASAAIAGGGPPVIELPLVERTPEAIQAARDEARELAGGSIKSAPLPEDANGIAPGGVTAAQLAATSGEVGKRCAGKMDYAMAWSLSLPAPLSIYPRGHLQEAAGTDLGGCRLRVVSFATPVDAGDVADFYYTRLSSAGYTARHRLADSLHVLDGAKGNAAYAIQMRKLDSGLTRVDLVANGG